MVRALESPTFGRQFIDGQEHADHSVAQEDSKSDANDESDQIGLDVVDNIMNQYASNRSGLNVPPPQATEEDDQTYIVPKQGGQGKNVNFRNQAAPDLRDADGEDATYMMGPNRQQIYNTGIQDKGPIDVTGEITYVAG